MDRRSNMKGTSQYTSQYPIPNYPPLQHRDDPPVLANPNIRYDRDSFASAPLQEREFDSESDSDDSEYAAYRRRRPVYDSFSEDEGDQDERKPGAAKRTTQKANPRDRVPRRPETQTRLPVAPATYVSEQGTRENYMPPYDPNYNGN